MIDTFVGLVLWDLVGGVVCILLVETLVVSYCLLAIRDILVIVIDLG